VLHNIITSVVSGIAAILLAAIGYLLRKVGVSKEMTALILKSLEQMLLQRAILYAENWAEKKAKETGQKIAGSEKMQKAIEEAKNILAELKSWGLLVNVEWDDDALKQKLQAEFDKIADKVNQAK
jgi:Zn-dependent protease with chaperone function